MADDKIFPNGMIFRAPRENAPDFVKGSLSIRVDDFINFLEEHAKPDGWVNIDLKESREGKYYAELNHYTRERQAPPPRCRPEPARHERAEPARRERPAIDYPKDDINPDDIPF
jgi:hypothetical protein